MVSVKWMIGAITRVVLLGDSLTNTVSVSVFPQPPESVHHRSPTSLHREELEENVCHVSSLVLQKK